MGHRNQRKQDTKEKGDLTGKEEGRGDGRKERRKKERETHSGKPS